MIVLWLTVLGLAADPPSASAPGEGAYAMVVDVASRSKVPVAGTAEVTTRSLVRIDLVKGASGWEQRQRVCAVEIVSDTRAETVLPPAFVRALPIQRYPVQLSQDGGSWSYYADPGPNFVGFDPKVTGGSVPAKRDAPGVLDHEGDGYPGATVLLDVPVLGDIRIYVAQKSWSRYRGQVQPDGAIAGQVEVVETVQETLGASVSLFAASPTIEPVPARSRFRMEPVPAAETCATLAARWQGGFSID